MALTTKVAAGGIAGAITVVVVWIRGMSHMTGRLSLLQLSR
jgi:type IV secretory pathway VirB2 component (pilin)